MQIDVSEIGKRFGRHWIFKNVNWKFDSGTCCSITGPNGSGKTTLLKIISGFGLPDKGQVIYSLNNQKIDSSNVYREVSIAAPYLHLIDSYTIKEQIQFQEQLKPFLSGISTDNVLKLLDMDTIEGKFIGECSTGMKQRIKLALAILSSGNLLLLDEPASNLDEQGVAWYHNILEKYRQHKTVLICSNHLQQDGVRFDDDLHIASFKP